MSEPAAKSDSGEERVWEQGWEEHERLQLQRLAKLPLAEKIAWLEQAHRLARKLEEQRKNQGK